MRWARCGERMGRIKNVTFWSDNMWERHCFRYEGINGIIIKLCLWEYNMKVCDKPNSEQGIS